MLKATENAVTVLAITTNFNLNYDTTSSHMELKNVGYIL
jgi:hypothetical protein